MIISDTVRQLEEEFSVCIEISDDSYNTSVYMYCSVPDAGTRLAVDFHGMGPSAERLRIAAQAMHDLRIKLDEAPR